MAIIDEAGLFGIYAILALSLNLEYGYCGIPNFGKVFFAGIGSFFTGSIVAHTMSWVSLHSLDICSASATYNRLNLASTIPVTLFGVFVLTLFLSAILAGAFGYLLSFPALRLREDYLGILLIAVGEMLRFFLLGIPKDVLYCEGDSLSAIPNPFVWLGNSSLHFAPPFDWVSSTVLTDGSMALLTLALTATCYFIIKRITNSPYGRMLKSIRDDEQASLSLGKKIAKVRGQVMVLGSAFSGIAGALLVYRLGGVSVDSYTTFITFLMWAIVLLGGAANNKGVLLGAFAIIALDLGTLLTRSTAVQLYPEVELLLSRASLDVYAQQLIVGALIILIIRFRPQGILAERPIKTPAWEVLKDSTGAAGEGNLRTWLRRLFGRISRHAAHIGDKPTQ